MRRIPHYEKNLLEQVSLSSKQKDIVEGYLKLSEEIGANNITIQKLSESLNISLGSIHYYFGPKKTPGLEETAIKYISQESIKFINYQMDRSLTANQFSGINTYIQVIFEWSRVYSHHAKFYFYFLYRSTHDPNLKKLKDQYLPLMRFRIEHVLLLGVGLGLYKDFNKLEILSEQIFSVIIGELLVSGMNYKKTDSAVSKTIAMTNALLNSSMDESLKETRP